MKSLAKRIFSNLLLGGGIALALSAGTALAAQNVANTSQKGSLLIFPLITVDQGSDTLIEISNDSPRSVHVECYYVNEKKGRVDFDFLLTGKQTVSWQVGTQQGDHVDPARFPSDGDYIPGSGYAPANPNRGELACFATNVEVTAQIAWNHLTGTATVTGGGVFRYNAWSFVARNAAGLPERNGVRQGTPGILELTGAGEGTYDACPVYNIANFMPNGAVLGTVTTTGNVLTVVSCKQDLRQDYNLNLTKLRFTTWNSNESSFTGAFICVDSVNSVFLASNNEYLVNGANFEYSTLRTPNARLHVSGVASTQCPGSTASALLGVLASDTNHGKTGTTTHGAGSAPGYVYWDISDDVPFKPKG